MAAAALVGARPLVEWLRLEWRPGTPLRTPSDRLAFRPVAGLEELVGLMTRVLDGTLDAYSRNDLSRMPAAEAAAESAAESAAFRRAGYTAFAHSLEMVWP
ncbi:hypothetical protein [Peterkaempfera bronchialis]|uniref:hypothetical protein n=1 Tax=Peterkaempfera bronchialis TaxID=2126346 RepID=UPI0015895BAF|nr:hypothetical protein [Peterkaempfera bronchialis]